MGILCTKFTCRWFLAIWKQITKNRSLCTNRCEFRQFVDFWSIEDNSHVWSFFGEIFALGFFNSHRLKRSVNKTNGYGMFALFKPSPIALVKMNLRYDALIHYEHTLAKRCTDCWGREKKLFAAMHPNLFVSRNKNAVVLVFTCAMVHCCTWMANAQLHTAVTHFLFRAASLT